MWPRAHAVYKLLFPTFLESISKVDATLFPVSLFSACLHDKAGRGERERPQKKQHGVLWNDRDVPILIVSKSRET